MPSAGAMPRKERRHLGLGKADQTLKIIALGGDVAEFLEEHVHVPPGQLGEAIVGDDVGPFISTGAAKPNSTIEAAICPICWGEWVRAFRT